MKRTVVVRIASFALVALLFVGSVGLWQALHGVPQAHAAVSGFVTRSGSQLMLNGQQFRFSGADMYWLALDENVGGIAYPTEFRVDDGFATAQEMGASVVRLVSLPIGCTLCLEPSLGSFNSTAFQHLDYAIKSAGDHGVRLIIGLVDNYHYYGGGKHTFTDWRGLSNESDFYTNTTVIGDFEQYISTVLNHVNPYTGLAYKDDPTILAWEEGNELYGAPASWVSTIADYIKQNVDSHHLVAFSASNDGGPDTVQQDTLSVANLDIEDAHFYPMSVSELNSFASATTQAGKAFYAGEYDWNNYPVSWKGNQTGDSLSSFLSAIETNGTAGDTFWSLFPHLDTYGYEQHGDGYTLHYPGDTSDLRSRAQALRTHAYTMQGASTPAHAAIGAPQITSINGQSIAWRGTAGADTYDVERSTTSATDGFSVVCAKCVTDLGTPWTDSSQPSGAVWYRVRGYNLDGAAGPYSSVAVTGASQNLVADPGYENQGSGTLSSPWAADLHDTSNCAAGVDRANNSAYAGQNNGWLYCNGNNAANTWAAHTQVVNVSPNTHYTLTVWTNNVPGTIGANAALVVGSVPFANVRQTQFTPTQGSYGQTTLSFTTLGSETQITLEVGYNAPTGTSTGLRIDDWSLTAG